MLSSLLADYPLKWIDRINGQYKNPLFASVNALLCVHLVVLIVVDRSVFSPWGIEMNGINTISTKQCITLDNRNI